LTVVKLRLCSVWRGVWFLLCSSQQASAETDREWVWSNGSLARYNVSQAIEVSLQKCKDLLSHLSYRGRVLIKKEKKTNLAAVCL